MKNEKIGYFASTVKPNKLWEYLAFSAKINSERKTKKKLKLVVIKKKFPSLSFFIFLIKSLLSLNIFFFRKFINLRYKDCDIGFHAAAYTYGNFSVYSSQFKTYFNILRSLFLAGSTIETAYELVKRVDAIFIDHPANINGIYFTIFCNNKKIIYSNFYPRGFFCIDKRNGKNKKIKNFLDARIHPSKKKITKKTIVKNKRYLNKIVSNPNKYVTWMQKTKYKVMRKNNLNFSKLKYIVYAHSFVDGPLDYGYDGFINLEEWLEFTIREIKKTNNFAIIKAHPNFYNPMFGDVAKNDARVFKKLKTRYEDEKLIFIDYPVKNFLLLQQIPKKTIIISHHGSTLLEATAMGFKSICSKSTFWHPKFNVSNQYTSISNYRNLLNSKWEDLKLFENRNKFYDLSNQTFFNKYGIQNNLFWQKFIEKESKKKLDISFQSRIGIKRHKITDHILQTSKEKIFKKLSNNIEEISI